jgi:hypothetical protein
MATRTGASAGSKEAHEPRDARVVYSGAPTVRRWKGALKCRLQVEQSEMIY